MASEDEAKASNSSPDLVGEEGSVDGSSKPSMIGKVSMILATAIELMTHLLLRTLVGDFFGLILEFLRLDLDTGHFKAPSIVLFPSDAMDSTKSRLALSSS